MAFTVPDAHLLALQAHEGQVDKQGRYRPARRILLAAEAADLVHGRRILV